MIQVTKNLLVVVIVAIFASCHAPDVVKDVVPPVVSIKLIQKGAYVHHTIPVVVHATDNAGVKKIELYLDNVLLTDATLDSLQFSWQTSGVADGAHALKAVAYDKAGNSSEIVSQVTVMNTLLKVTIDEDFIQPHGQGYVFISDRAGKLIKILPMVNNTTLTFETPMSYTDSVFTYSYFIRYDRDFGYGQNLYSFVNILPAATEFFAGYPQPSITGHAQLSLPDADDNFTGILIDGNGIYENPVYGSKAVDLQFYKPSSDLFYSNTVNDTCRYKYLESIKPGDVLTIANADLKKMSRYDFSLPISGSVNCIVVGYKGSVSYDLSNQQTANGRAKIERPEEISFDSYRTFIIMNDNKNSYINNEASLSTSVNLITSDVTSYAIDGNKVSIKIVDKNDFDYIYASASNYDANFNGSNFELYVSGAESSTFSMPDIPSELIQLAFPTQPKIVLSTWGLVDLSSWTRSKDLLKMYLDGSVALSRVKSVYFSDQSNSGGRKKSLEPFALPYAFKGNRMRLR